jgi:polyisoprenoid-binding protein YceI
MRPSIRLPVLLWLLCGGAATQAADAVYTIDAAASDFHWLVYKAGAFARLGHNHVIRAGVLDGKVTVDGSNPVDSRFEIVIPVADLTIDDPALRSGLGEEFASVPTPDDIAGTRTNMLSERVLDGATFPMIRVTGTGPIDAQGAQTLKVEVELLGRTIDLTVPTKVSIEPERVEASGEFELNHADLGMQPFSVMMGALQVGEKLSFTYRIIARLVP